MAQDTSHLPSTFFMTSDTTKTSSLGSPWYVNVADWVTQAKAMSAPTSTLLTSTISMSVIFTSPPTNAL